MDALRRAAAVLVLFAAFPLLAQQPTGRTPAARAADPGVVAFGERPLRLPSVGLTVKVPEDATAESSMAGEAASAQIIPDDQTWMIDIQTPRTGVRDATPRSVADEIIQQVLAASGTIYLDGQAAAVRGRVMERADNLVLPGGEASRFYLEIHGERGQPSTVRGYTVFKVSADRFVTFDLRAAMSEFSKARRIYETVVGTATFADATAVEAGRKAAIEAGLRLFAELDSATIESIIARNTERWQRRFIPSSTGARADDEEEGYTRLRCRVGRRGELDPTRRPANWRLEERQEGIIFEMDARVLMGKQIIDSKSIFFMTRDRNEEAWNVRVAVRQGKDIKQFTEIGFRNGSDLTIRIEGGDGATLKPELRGNPLETGYVNRVEAYLLPQFMVALGVPTEFGYYSWNTAAGKVTLRRDLLEQPSGAPGAWKLTTRLAEDDSPVVSYYNAKGDFVRSEIVRSDGKMVVTEPIELNALVQLWRSKKLPME